MDMWGKMIFFRGYVGQKRKKVELRKGLRLGKWLDLIGLKRIYGELKPY